PRPSATCVSSRPAASARRTSPSTSTCPPSPPSAAAGWSRGTSSPPAASPRSPQRWPRPWPSRADGVVDPHARNEGDPVTLQIRDAAECRYDVLSLGEVMLRLDPGEGRIRTARSFRVWEGGGEYNV